ncbi:MAG: RNA polymerase sigma factor [Candidatus Kerfeldbacteria bacterium]|nr:RNA polymerase sigma factor [Candidatus Kerfeldbacteria bacterium]
MNISETQALLQKHYHSLSDYLWGYVSVRVFDASAREDIVADIFLHAIKSMHTFDPERGDIKQWITGVAKYRILNYFRTTHKATPDLEHAEEIIDEHASHLSQRVADTMACEELLRDLLPEHRALLYLHYVDGFSIAELARKEAIPAARLRKRLSRIIHGLRSNA